MNGCGSTEALKVSGDVFKCVDEFVSSKSSVMPCDVFSTPFGSLGEFILSNIFLRSRLCFHSRYVITDLISNTNVMIEKAIGNTAWFVEVDSYL